MSQNTPADPYAWCRRRLDETAAEHRARMLASVPEGLKRNTVRPCPVAAYFGFERAGAGS